MDIMLDIDEPFDAELDPAGIAEAVRLALARFTPGGLPKTGSVNVVVTGAEAIQELNLEYLGIDAPTDVLSFENVPDPDFPQVDADHLGDIIIAYPVAQAQAQAAGHSVQAEVTLLAVHGALHLSGFDHDTAEAKAQMWAAQRQVMTELGLASVQPTEE